MSYLSHVGSRPTTSVSAGAAWRESTHSVTLPLSDACERDGYLCAFE